MPNNRNTLNNVLAPIDLGIRLNRPFPAVLLPNLFIDKGPHLSRKNGVCILEAISWINGEEHSDDPICVNNKLSEIVMEINDTISNKERQKLKTLIPYIIGTNGYIEYKNEDKFDNESKTIKNVKYKKRLSTLLNKADYKVIMNCNNIIDSLDILSFYIYNLNRQRKSTTAIVDLTIDLIKDYSNLLKKYVVPNMDTKNRITRRNSDYFIP